MVSLPDCLALVSAGRTLMLDVLEMRLELGWPSGSALH